MAIRVALGAGRLRLVRLLLTEGVLLALLGGVLGSLLALWGTDLLLRSGSPAIPRLEEAGIDGRVLGFTLALSLLTGLLFGLVPALQVSRPDVHGFLKEGWQGVAVGPGRYRLRSALVVSEVALSLVLLAGAGLMAKSFTRLLRADPGFPVDRLLTFQLSLPESRYSEDSTQAARFHEQVLDRLRALPGVEAVTAASVLPLGGGDYTQRAFVAEEHPTPPAGPEYLAHWNAVAPGYFATMGIPLLAGRQFGDEDQAHSPPVIIINQALAQKIFPDEDPIGRRIRCWRGGARSEKSWVLSATFASTTSPTGTGAWSTFLSARTPGEAWSSPYAVPAIRCAWRAPFALRFRRWTRILRSPIWQPWSRRRMISCPHCASSPC